MIDAEEVADAVRLELRSRMLDAHGTLQAAALATGIPYKTLYRHLTRKGQDRTASTSLQFVIQLVQHLEAEFGGDDFATFWEYATRNVG